MTTILYTIPSLALFELLVAPVGLNVYLGRDRARLLHAADPVPQHPHGPARRCPRRCSTRPRAWACRARQTLLRVELPLALPAIIAGLRIAVVTIIALATIVYTIYDRGLGVPIHTALGEGPFKTELIAAGGLAIVLALLADGLLVLAQRLLTPWARARAS